jgi:hypothetical protein
VCVKERRTRICNPSPVILEQKEMTIELKISRQSPAVDIFTLFVFQRDSGYPLIREGFCTARACDSGNEIELQMDRTC